MQIGQLFFTLPAQLTTLTEHSIFIVPISIAVRTIIKEHVVDAVTLVGNVSILDTLVNAIETVHRSITHLIVAVLLSTIGEETLESWRRLWWLMMMHRMLHGAFARVDCKRLFHVECVLDFRFLIPHLF